MKRTVRNVIISKLKEVLTAIEENIVGGTAIALEVASVKMKGPESSTWSPT
jgi:hypothetical protein